MKTTLLLLLCFIGINAWAEDILMARSPHNFEHTLQNVKDSVLAHGYTIAHVQKCDGGLTGFGYKTAPYRLLFIGKGKEIRALTQKHTALIPYLPLKLAVYAEGDETIVAIFNPEKLGKLFNDPELHNQFSRWKSDFDSILDDVRKQ